MEKYLVLFLAVISSAQSALPNGWKACSKSSNEFNKCFKDQVNFAISTLINGDKKLGSLPLDPLRITTLDIPRHDSPVSISLLFKDIDVIGLKNLKVTEGEHDWKTTKATAFIPHASILGDYKIDGKVLVLPITGEGKCNLTFTDLTLGIDALWKKIEHKGTKFFQMDKLNLDLKPKRLYIQLDNLFKGDKALGDNTNMFLNENWDQILTELKPSITSGLSQALTQIANRILSKIPAHEMEVK